MFQRKRIYEAAAAADGRRVLVDRLWPRGVSKEKAKLDDWLKDIAPSPDLRNWFGHQAERFDEFSSRYRDELSQDPAKQAAVQALLEAGKAGRVTLLYGAKDPDRNQAAVLQAYLQERAAATSQPIAD